MLPRSGDLDDLVSRELAGLAQISVQLAFAGQGAKELTSSAFSCSYGVGLPPYRYIWEQSECSLHIH